VANWETADGNVWPALAAVLASALLLAGCEGTQRRFSTVEPLTGPEDAAGSPSNLEGNGSGSPSSDVAGGRGIEGSRTGNQQAGGLGTDDGQSDGLCSNDGDAGTCVPLPLCDENRGADCAATCPGCIVDGDCIAVDAINPDNVCQVCDPERDARAWSARNGVTCEDGLFCTTDDACTNGACVGVPRACDDDVACNGVSTCDEAGKLCSPDVNECGTSALCNVATDACVSSCVGCLVAGVCFDSGAEAAGNPCSVCNPAVSSTSFTGAIGKSCGAGASVCSQQDTCDAQARCQPNHLPANTPCGNPLSSACDQSDTCDGNGSCQQRLAPNGTGCDDGAFCTVNDQCQGGQCVPGGNRLCGANQACSEAAAQCQCLGCQVGNTCVSATAVNPANPCQICDPNRSRTVFSANPGAQCGSGPAECSGQDTCNAQGLCLPNDRTGSCTSVTGGSCQNGVCAAPRQLNGIACTVAAECVSGFCRLWFQDLDGDAHGGSVTQMLCSPSPANDEIVAQFSGRTTAVFRDASGRNYSSLGDDCCDSSQAVAGSIFPGNTNVFVDPQRACPDINPFDYDCSGTANDPFPGTFQTVGCGNACSGAFWVEPRPACGQPGQIQNCVRTAGVCGLGTPESSLRVCN